jgi:hypothetical protein
MKGLLNRVWKSEPTVSDSEVALFGGALRYGFGCDDDVSHFRRGSTVRRR